MKLSTPNCPECGEQANGTLEQMCGLALLNYLEDGTVEYAGSTDIYWDEQKSVYEPGTQKITLICHNGHDWFSGVDENLVDEYREKHGVWAEYPGHPREDWRGEVANVETNLGYWEWVEHREEKT